MRKIALISLLVVPTMAFAQPQKSDERQNVIMMFDTLLPVFDVKAGDGLGSSIDCVFSRKWDQSYHRDASGEQTEAFQARELLTIEQALDPSGHNNNMFCDYRDRDAQAQKAASDQNKDVAVASIGFSYPDFGPDDNSASVYYQRWSQIFAPGKRKFLPVGSNGLIKFVRHNGVWSFETVNSGTMN